jgi:hypothetical protein
VRYILLSCLPPVKLALNPLALLHRLTKRVYELETSTDERNQKMKDFETRTNKYVDRSPFPVLSQRTDRPSQPTDSRTASTSSDDLPGSTNSGRTNARPSRPRALQFPFLLHLLENRCRFSFFRSFDRRHHTRANADAPSLPELPPATKALSTTSASPKPTSPTSSRTVASGRPSAASSSLSRSSSSSAPFRRTASRPFTRRQLSKLESSNSRRSRRIGRRLERGLKRRTGRF